MSYKIEYSQHKGKRYPENKKETNYLKIVLSLVLTLVIVFCCLTYNISEISERYFTYLDELALLIKETDIGKSIAVSYAQILDTIQYD